MVDVRVKRLRVVEKGKLKAMVEIQIGELIIRGLKLIEGKGGLWVAWPQAHWRDMDGQWRYQDIVQSTRETQEAVRDAVLKVWEAAGLSLTNKSFKYVTA